MAKASRSATRATVLLGSFGTFVAAWRAGVTTLDRLFDRKTRIAVAMAIVATLSAIAAYRASDEERKSSMCEHQLAEAQTYELIERQRYLDAAVEYERLSDRYAVGFQRSERLRRHALALRGAVRRSSTEPAPGALDVEAELDLAVARTVEPVRDFTDPGLPARTTLERSLRARAEHDVRELGIPSRCAVNDDSRVKPSVGIASNPKDEEYLEPLHRHVEQLHAKSRSDAFAVVGFVIVLVLFTLSEVAIGAVRRVLEILAIAGIPVSFAAAVLQNDDGMARYLSAALLFLCGLFAMVWATMRWFDRTAVLQPAHVDRRKRSSHLWADFKLARILYVSAAVALASLLVRANYDVSTGGVLVGPIFDLLMIFMTCVGLLAWITIDSRHGIPSRADSKRLDRVATGAVLTFAFLVPGVPFAAFAVRRDSYTYLWAFYIGAAILAVALTVFVVLCLIWIARQASDDERSAQTAVPDDVEPAPAPITVGHVAPHHVEAPEMPIDMPEGSAGKHIHWRSVQELRDRWIVALIAITALFSAILTATYTNETAIASSFAAKAADEQLDLMRSSSRLATETYRTIDGLVALGESRLRSIGAGELRSRAARENAKDGVAIWEHEGRRWDSTLDILSNRVVIDPADETTSLPLARLFDGVTGPDSDPAFPAKLFITATVQKSAERLALWDAYDERTTASEARGDVLLGGATLFAIALYLFGQSLGMGATNRGGTVLAFFGTGLLLLGIALGAKAFFVPVPPVEELVTLPEACRSNDETARLTRAEAAAKCYGHAEAALALSNDADAYKRAHEAYETATLQRLRPGFALAHYRSVRATSEVATSQSDVRHVSIVDQDALETIVKQESNIITDLERRERNVPATLRETFGFHQYLHALDTGDEALIQNAIANLRKAQEAAEVSDGLVDFRLAIALFADHSDVESGKAYGTALNARAQSDEVRATAITDLEVLRSAACKQPNRFCRSDDEIGAHEAVIARAMKPSSAREAPLPKPRVLNASLTPDGIRWALIPSAPLAAMPTSLFVYRHEPKRNVWYVIPAASGVLDPSEFRLRSPRKVTGIRRVLTRPHEAQCLETDGTYLIELRVGGTVLGRARASTPALPHFGRVVLRGQGVALCAPDGADGWTRTPTVSNRLRAGYHAKDGSSGVNVYAMFAPRNVRPSDGRSFLTRAMDDTLLEIQDRGLDRAPDWSPRSWCKPQVDAASTIRAGYSMPQLQILAESWPSKDGLMHVAIVWSAARSGAPAAAACQVLASITSIDAGAGSSTFEF
ncbi:MAG: hypothetical protein M3169_05435 [Candidatus Eremiobacteraeota bacterium]|nr:hypothetical protein [Candidatus Eremiobacteraeota bacterium]